MKLNLFWKCFLLRLNKFALSEFPLFNLLIVALLLMINLFSPLLFPFY